MAAIRSGFLALMLALGGCSGGDSAGSDSTGDTPAPAALVTLAPATRGSIAETVDIYGSAQNDPSSTGIMAAPAEAIVAEILAPEGQLVRRGEVVVRLTASPSTRLEIANATSDHRAARLAYERAQRLRADGLISDAEVESARAAAESSAATIASLNNRSGALTLRAPVSGYVQAYTVGPGDLVAAGTPIAAISRAGDLRAQFGIDPELARRVERSASFSIIGPDGQVTLGVPILSVNPVVSPQTRLASIFVRIPAAAGFGAGESLHGRVTLSSTDNALSVPYAALLNDGGQPFVFSVEKGVARRHDVQLGPVSNERAAIVSGLAETAQVVVEGGTALEDGMAVRTQ